MKLNCDLAEGTGCEAAVLPFIDQANIACGAHAGDESLMQSTAALAQQCGVSIGAHPGYPDRRRFGRVSLEAGPDQIRQWVADQVHSLAAMGPVDYVKPHGALYHDMVRHPEILAAVREAIGELPLMGPAGLMDGWEWSEAFADRRYQADQRLVPRSEPGAVLDEAETLAQVRRLLTKGEVTTIDGTPVSLSATTLCVHGDNPVGVSLIRAIREMLDEG